jgi:hypothetical protein
VDGKPLYFTIQGTNSPREASPSLAFGKALAAPRTVLAKRIVNINFGNGDVPLTFLGSVAEFDVAFFCADLSASHKSLIVNVDPPETDTPCFVVGYPFKGRI